MTVTAAGWGDDTWQMSGTDLLLIKVLVQQAVQRSYSWEAKATQ